MFCFSAILLFGFIILLGYSALGYSATRHSAAIVIRHSAAIVIRHSAAICFIRHSAANNCGLRVGLVLVIAISGAIFSANFVIIRQSAAFILVK